MTMPMKMLIRALCAGAIALAVAAPAAQASTYAQTRYPIVLVHGLMGFSSIAGVEYFYQIPETLRSQGAVVYTVKLSQSNNDIVRGEQLLSQVEQILAATGAKKVNLIGHSQGGLDARYVAAVRPDLVASVTTVGTPHKGSAVADLLLSTNGFTQSVVNSVLNGISELIAWISGGSGNPQSAQQALEALSSSGTAAFNKSYPAGVPTSCSGDGAHSAQGVQFYSWGGTGVLTNVLDATDPFLGLTSLAFGFTGNDGLVSQCSNHFGKIIADNYFQNHLDEVNQFIGLVSPFTTNPLTLFSQQANRLKNAGL
jgi:triacylglycerol lipase